MIFSLKNLTKIALALLIGYLGLRLRMDAAARLPIDADEDTYINTALHYSWSIHTGNWKQIYKYTDNEQHPILTKLAYAGALLTVFPAEKLQQKDIPRLPVMETPGRLWILTARRAAAWFGGIAVFCMALLNPVAGLLLAFHTSAIKFTSEIYLESVPMLTSLLVIMTYDAWQKKEFTGPDPAPRMNLLWLLASAVFLGMTAAGKYIYCVVAIAAGLDFIVRLASDRRRIKQRVGMMAAWGAVSIAAFLAFNPILWLYTFDRLVYSINFHINYSQSWDVKGSARPWWYPLYLLFQSVPDTTQKLKGIFYLEPDRWISLAALAGVPFLWKKSRPYALWLGVCLAFLLLWATKWDQYLLIVVPALCLSAGELTLTLARFVMTKIRSAIRPISRYN